MNDGEEPSRRSSRRRAARIAGALVVAGALGVCGWAGCSIEKDYDTLSFFFDGVPEPRAKGPGGGPATLADLRDSPTYSAHKPFKEDRCDDCHGGRFRLSRKDSSVCMKCHDKIPSSQERMHGPVAAEACLWCHTPHESAYAHLLKNEPRTVCSECHDTAQLDAERVPAHADASRSCVECHFGHGGTQRFFLRPSAAAPERPAAASPGPEEHP